MRILYVVPGLQIAGGVRIAVEHVNRLIDRGHEVVVTPTDRITQCTWLPLKAEILHPMGAEAEEWEVVVATEAGTWDWVHKNIKAERKYGICQMKEHYFYREPVRDTVRDLFKYPLIPITISTWLREWLLQWHDKVFLIPNGVNFKHFYPDPLVTEYIKTDKPIILIEGRELSDDPDPDFPLIEAKNTRDAHAAVDKLREMGYDVLKWGFSQDPREGERWEWDQFWFTPGQDLIRQIYSTAGESGGFLLKTSRYEGRNCTVVEAMACKCPVVATRCGGVDDLHHKETCLLVPYGDIDALIDVGKWILGPDDIRELLREQAHRYVHRNLDWDTIIPTLESILTDPDRAPQLQVKHRMKVDATSV